MNRLAERAPRREFRPSSPTISVALQQRLARRLDEHAAYLIRQTDQQKQPVAWYVRLAAFLFGTDSAGH